MEKFFRKIKLKAHFNNNEETLEDEEETDEQQTDEEIIFRNKSRWTPYNVHQTVETFIEAVKSDIYSTPKVPLPKNNLSKKEIKTMNDLKNIPTNEGVEIKRAYKYKYTFSLSNRNT